ncbi:outer membrane beta-barrel protein [Gramella sp. KN1008]|uniref:outer membrane beta-barrel protein n=1 Tax=Gramella sp. KN1008 TaxID=2529298 RepID=UPI00103FFBA1|nr:outer membrane beta-barrel protein [Gramella sp. KN1008]TBW25880.1 hypothetical protein EZJ28_14705 [Gramella sp. KN1008]
MKLFDHIFNKISRKSLLIIAFGLVSMPSLIAQSKSELSIHVKGQFSKLDFEVLQEDSEMDNGYGVGINYAFYLDERWSIITGAEYQAFSTNVFLDNISGSSEATDQEGENFEFRYTASGYQEDQNVSFISIPLKLQYETTGPIGLYVAGGIKIGFDVQSSSESKTRDLITSAYYPQYNTELSDPLFMGFGEFERYKSDSEFDLKTNYILNLETGVKLEVNDMQNLYLGLFIDYGMNNLKEDGSGSEIFMYDTENPTDFKNESVLYASQNTNPIVEEFNSIAFGLKLRYGLRL